MWKGVISPGQSWNDLVDFSDLLPTVVDLTGGALPTDVQLDGHSFAARLRGEGRSTRHWADAESAERFFLKTRNRKLYNAGEFFDTEAEPFENSPLDATRLSSEAASDWELLMRAIAEFR